MLLWSIMLSLCLSFACASAGKVEKIVGAQDAYLMRGQEKITISTDMELKEGDEVFSSNAYVVLLLHPASQLSMNKQSQMKITKSEIDESQPVVKATSIVDLIKGLIRVMVTKQEGQEVEQQVTSSITNVAFAVRGTEFEVSLDDEGADLDVIEGEVEVSSPLVQTFVPEIVKANEGFKFSKRQKKFMRRKMAVRFKHHPGFLNKGEMKERWKKRHERRAEKMKDRKNQNKDRREEKAQRRENRSR
ncbi:MAG TPA: FecR domain-containing protein [Bacteriovoracaceae bacterium]|nr:FecR domain-containing protein [Bacteriovoracaceae bacterium]